jgi:UDP-N-acetylmuramyl pentapeptide phosphotransferase/UDP-N-acetylglucosamine-1-phosphate transferase
MRGVVAATDFAALAAGVIGAVVSAFVVEVVRRRAVVLGLVDLPNPRSSHRTPMPKGGGLGILAGLLAGIALIALDSTERFRTATLALVLCSLTIAAVGLVDDRKGLSSRLRLFLQLATASIFVAAAGPIQVLPLPEPFAIDVRYGWAAMILTVLWLTAVTNFFNFMDGVDGLAGGQAVASSIGIAVAAWSSDAVAISASLCGASLGFLLYNWPPARVFMGDVGSGAIGFLLGGLPLLAPVENRSAAVLAVAIGLTFFILDPVLTLCRRVLKGEPIMQAHRQHLYQKLVPVGAINRRVISLLVAGALFLSLTGSLAFRDFRLTWIAAASAVVLFSAEIVYASRSEAH